MDVVSGGSSAKKNGRVLYPLPGFLDHTDALIHRLTGHKQAVCKRLMDTLPCSIPHRLSAQGDSVHLVHIRIDGHLGSGAFSKVCDVHTLGLKDTSAGNACSCKQVFHPYKVRSHRIGHGKAGHSVPVHKDPHEQFRKTSPDLIGDPGHVGDRLGTGFLFNGHVVHILYNDSVKMVLRHHFRLPQGHIHDLPDPHPRVPVTAGQRLRLDHGQYDL